MVEGLLCVEFDEVFGSGAQFGQLVQTQSIWCVLSTLLQDLKQVLSIWNDSNELIKFGL